MEGCIFCDILEGRAEASFLFRGQTVSAFLDIQPINPGHVLIVPNQHCERFEDLAPELVSALFERAQAALIALQATSSIRCNGANLFLSAGSVAGQQVPHAHLHLVPRFEGDGHRMGFAESLGSRVGRQELNEVAGALSKALPAKVK
jgi:histidine triad (HIT) family protein